MEKEVFSVKYLPLFIEALQKTRGLYIFDAEPKCKKYVFM